MTDTDNTSPHCLRSKETCHLVRVVLFISQMCSQWFIVLIKGRNTFEQTMVGNKTSVFISSIREDMVPTFGYKKLVHV